MNKELIVICEAYFIATGTTVDSVTVSRMVKPDNDPTSNWPTLGTIPKDGLRVTGTPVGKIQVDRPRATGGWERYKSVPTQTDWEIAFSLQDINLVGWRALLGAAAAISSGTALETFRHKEIEGWLKIQFRDYTNTILGVIDAYGVLMGGEFSVPSAGLATPPFNFEVWGSVENAGKVTWA